MQTEHSSSLSQFVISLYHTDEFQLAQQTAALPSPASLVAAMDLGIISSKSVERGPVTMMHLKLCQRSAT